MKFVFMICDDESEQPGPAELAADSRFDRYRAAVAGKGRGGGRLRPSADATTVRVRDGEVLISDGPFAETKEQIGGFDLIECDSMEEAVELAKKHAVIDHGGSVEVREIWEM